MDAKARVARLRFQVDGPVMLSDDAQGGIEAKACASSHALRGEEGIEDATLCVRRNAGAIVADFHNRAIRPRAARERVARPCRSWRQYGLLQEINNSTRRISDLVTTIKRYSYMDRGAVQEVNLQEDLENTLKIFGNRLKNGITVIRDYDPQLPRVCAYGGELNQVWTNLIAGRPQDSIYALVEPLAAQDHWDTPFRPRCPRLRLLRTRDMKDARLPPSRRERFECRLQLRSGIEPGLQLLRNRIL